MNETANSTFQVKTAYRGVSALAAELGVSRFHLSRVLNGHRFAGERLAGELAARGVSVKVRGNETSSTSPADRTHESARVGLPAGETSSQPHRGAGRSAETPKAEGHARDWPEAERVGNAGNLNAAQAAPTVTALPSRPTDEPSIAVTGARARDTATGTTP